jgi:hypothetical protein
MAEVLNGNPHDFAKALNLQVKDASKFAIINRIL